MDMVISEFMFSRQTNQEGVLTVKKTVSFKGTYENLYDI